MSETGNRVVVLREGEDSATFELVSDKHDSVKDALKAARGLDVEGEYVIATINRSVRLGAAEKLEVVEETVYGSRKGRKPARDRPF